MRIVTFTGVRVRDFEKVSARELEGNAEKLADCHLLLDFTNAETFSRAELQMLVTFHQKLQGCGVQLTLFNLNLPVFSVFTVTHLENLIGMCKMSDDAE